MSKGGGQGSFAQMQEPGMSMDMGGFGGGAENQYGSPQLEAMERGGFFGGGPQPAPAFERPQMDNRMGIPQPMPMPLEVNHGPESFDRFSGGLGSKGGRSNPYQTDAIVPPGRTAGLPNQLQPIRGGRDFLPTPPIAQPIVAPGVDPRLDSQPIADAVQPPVGGIMYAGGTPYFNEGTGEFTKPPRGPVKLQPIKMQPLPFEPVLSDGPDFRPPMAPDMPPTPPRRIDVPAIPDDMLDEIQSRGTVGPGGGTRGRTGSFRDAIREFRDEFRYQPMPRPRPRPEPPIFGPPRNFPFPMPRPPRMPPRMPGRNTQFQMPFFGSPYGQMNPYAGQFSGYGVPSNMFSFAQPHYQPYVPPPPQPSAPPVMQLPPDQGNQVFSGAPVAYTPPAPVAFGGRGIGGFGRYNLGLARRQFGGR